MGMLIVTLWWVGLVCLVAFFVSISARRVQLSFIVQDDLCDLGGIKIMVQGHKTPARPRYPHDCDACHFLGYHDEYDLYFCEARGRPTVIARYGAGGAYQSGIYSTVPWLVEAKRRAVASGFRVEA